MTIIDAVKEVLSQNQQYRYRIGRDGQRAEFSISQPITLTPEELIADDWFVKLN